MKKDLNEDYLIKSLKYKGGEMRDKHDVTCNLFHTWREDGQFLPLNYGKPDFRWQCTCGFFDEEREKQKMVNIKKAKRIKRMKLYLILILFFCAGCATYDKSVGIEYPEGSNQFIEVVDYTNGKREYYYNDVKLEDFAEKEKVDIECKEFWEWAK